MTTVCHIYKKEIKLAGITIYLIELNYKINNP